VLETRYPKTNLCYPLNLAKSQFFTKYRKVIGWGFVVFWAITFPLGYYLLPESDVGMIFMYFLAMGVFILVLNVKFRSRLVNKLGAATFGVYILHAGVLNIYGTLFIGHDGFVEQIKPHLELYPLIPLVALGLFTVCILTEVVRKEVVSKISAVLQKIQPRM
jgi:peptidoglycan/LPS O-acetylase OafA/YrhL